MIRRRLIVGGAVGSAAPLLAGCANKPLRAANVDGTYRFRVNSKSRRKTCTPESVPAVADDAQAKALPVDTHALTVYVVRKRWADAVNVVELSVDGQRVASTVPNSFVRFKLAPGSHRSAALWQGESIEQKIAGVEGQLVVVELVGSAWAWASDYKLEIGNLESTGLRVQSSWLVADRDLRA